MTQWDRYIFFTRLFTRKANNPSACIRIEVISFYSVYTHKICLCSKIDVLRLRQDKMPILCITYALKHFLSRCFWWWTLAINWMTYDQYIYILRCKCQQSSLMSPRVSMCIDFVWSLPRNVYFFQSLVGSSFMCQFSWFY